MKAILMWLIAACVSNATAQIVSRDSLHLKPVGTKVSGSFVLVNRLIPLPEGEFSLVAAGVHDSKLVYGDFAGQQNKLADVALGQMADGKLRAAVVATALLAQGRARQEWTDEPCKRADTLFKRDSVPFMKRNYSQNCLMVNHVVNTLGPKATGMYAQAAAWIKDQGGETPIPTVIQVSITRIEVADYLAVHYAFNPDAYGCAPASSSWTTSEWHKSRVGRDPERNRFVSGVIDFGKAMQVVVNEAFEGRRDVAQKLHTTTPAILACK